jgi:MarR family transcriptional regulator, negative regulator of the multidrug operon emrRAB
VSHTYEANVLGALGVAIGDRLARAGATGTAAEALVALGGDGAGMTIDGLARRVGLSHSGAVRLVDRLVKQDQAQRSRGSDQRTAALELTPEGRRTARRILARRQHELETMLGLLDDEEQRKFVESAERLLRRVAAEGDEGDRICRLCDHDACGHSTGTCPLTAAR